MDFMKKRLVSCLCALLCVVMLAVLLPTAAQAAVCKHTYENNVCTACGQIGGTCGAKLTWTFSPSVGVLAINGTGTMDNYTTDFPAPWYPWREQVKEVMVGAAVTSLGTNAFCECRNLTTINIPNSISNINTSSFLKCDSLETFDLAEKANYVLDEKGVLYNKKMT